MVRPRDLREAVAWVDRSGIAPLIEGILRPTRRGRPRQLTVRTLFVGMKLAVDTSKTACLTDVHALLTEGLAPSAQRDLGVIDGRTGAVITLHQIRRLLSAIQAKLDPSPATAAGFGPDELEQRAASLQEVLDLMLAATMPTAIAHTGGYAVDGTGTWSWAKGRKREDRSPDPDAAWGVKTHKSGRTESYFGYELHAVVRIGPTGAKGSDTPCLAERISVVPASTSPTRPVLDTLARMTADGHRIRDVVADRGYTYKNDWAPGLHALGIDPVADLHANQYGPRGTHAGARIVAGTPHCPAMPAGFDTIHRPDRLVPTPALDTFTADIERREQWALRRVAGPDLDGKERYECPARAGKLRCPLQPDSLALPLATPTVLAPPDPDTAPTCCTPAHHHRPRRRRRQGTPTPLLGQPQLDQGIQPAVACRGLVRQPQERQHRGARPRRLPRHGHLQDLPHGRRLRRSHQPPPPASLGQAQPRKRRPHPPPHHRRATPDRYRTDHKQLGHRPAAAAVEADHSSDIHRLTAQSRPQGALETASAVAQGDTALADPRDGHTRLPTKARTSEAPRNGLRSPSGANFVSIHG